MKYGFRNIPGELAEVVDNEREEVKHWFWLLEKLLPAINGDWRKHLEGKSVMSEYVTVSDEGFALLLLHKIVDKWDNEEETVGEVQTGKTKGRKREHYTEDDWKLYTKKCLGIKEQRKHDGSKNLRIQVPTLHGGEKDCKENKGGICLEGEELR